MGYVCILVVLFDAATNQDTRVYIHHLNHVVQCAWVTNVRTYVLHVVDLWSTHD